MSYNMEAAWRTGALVIVLEECEREPLLVHIVYTERRLMPPQASRVSCGVPRSRSAVAARRRSPTFKFPGTDVALPVQVLCQIFFQERPLLAQSPRTASDRIPAHRACSSGRATGGYPPEAGSGQEADLSSTAPPQSLYFPAPICGSGPSRCNPCQARTLSTMNALSAPTVQMSATPSRKNSPSRSGAAA